jgi:hypothetical protein
MWLRFDAESGQMTNMRFRFVAGGVTICLALLTGGVCLLAQQATQGAAVKISARHARQIAVLVARHEHIDLSDTHIEFNSMDMGRSFVRGFSSFIIIREATTPGPDETLRRYAVNRTTGDVWEINLCTHYDFPELTHLRQLYSGEAATPAAAIAAQSRELGCTKENAAPAS